MNSGVATSPVVWLLLFSPPLVMLAYRRFRNETALQTWALQTICFTVIALLAAWFFNRHFPPWRVFMRQHYGDVSPISNVGVVNDGSHAYARILVTANSGKFHAGYYTVFMERIGLFWVECEPEK
jgi:hypothetical protein